MATKPAPKKLPPWLQEEKLEKEGGKHEKPKTIKKSPPKKKGC